MTSRSCSHQPGEHPAPLGTEAWLAATGGQLTRRQSAALLRPVVRAFGSMVAGRLMLATRRHPGRRAVVDPAALMPPDSALSREAEDAACELLSPGLLRHSYRTYMWGSALAVVDGLACDPELLFIASMLHDTGLPTPRAGTDFTARSIEILDACGVGAQLGGPRRQVVADAMGCHHTPGIRVADGVEHYLLSAGAAVDVLGMRIWDLPAAVPQAVLRDHARAGFAQEMAALWTQESRLVPRGRAAFLRRWAAINLMMRVAPLER